MLTEKQEMGFRLEEQREEIIKQNQNQKGCYDLDRETGLNIWYGCSTQSSQLLEEMPLRRTLIHRFIHTTHTVTQGPG